jgi:cell division protein FtsQ
VLTAAGVHEGTSLFRVDAGAIDRRVARLRPVAAVHVKRRWPHGIVIEVTERTPVGVVTDGGRTVLLDAGGVAFADVAKPPPGLVPVAVGAPVPGDGSASAQAAMRVLAELPSGVRGQVSAVSAPTPDAVRLHLANGRSVVWGSAAQGATKAAVLRTLLRRSAQVYDVSTPSVAVTRG